MNSDFIIGRGNPHILFTDYAPAQPQLAAEPAPPTQTTDTVEADAPPPNTTSNTTNVNTASGMGAPQAEEHELSFHELLDIVNPLQHIPILSSIYRAVTGDGISSFAEVAGGAIYGGPIGLISGVITAAVEEATGASPVKMVANALGFKSEETEVASAATPKTLDAQVAEAVPPKEEEMQMASSDPPPAKGQSLNDQIAASMPPPLSSNAVQMASAASPPGVKNPFGGIMDMGAVDAARSGPPSVTGEIQTADSSNPQAQAPAPLLPHPPAAEDGHKFYSLASARRFGGQQVAMPINSGPDVRLKPVTRQAINTTPRPTLIPITPPEGEAQRILGLSPPVANAASANNPPLTPADADLFPGSGASQAVPPALIEDLMKQGLDKYQKGLENGTLSAPSVVDVKG